MKLNSVLAYLTLGLTYGVVTALVILNFIKEEPFGFLLCVVAWGVLLYVTFPGANRAR